MMRHQRKTPADQAGVSLDRFGNSLKKPTDVERGLAYGRLLRFNRKFDDRQPDQRQAFR